MHPVSGGNGVFFSVSASFFDCSASARLLSAADIPADRQHQENADARTGKVDHHVAEFTASAGHKALMILIRAGI